MRVTLAINPLVKTLFPSLLNVIEDAAKKRAGAFMKQQSQH
jgi:hypothetical protein